MLKDDLSSTVLTLNLRGTPPLDWIADAGEPAVLTLRSLTRRAPVASVPTPCDVYICASTLGPACPPMVCLQGQPSAAALTLLSDLFMRGAHLLYHGDFDWALCASPRHWREAALGGRGVTRPPITEQQ
ncbi:DUF2399 domain-containing protein [Streptomyces sp. NPDC006624]|uniref:DUF2399 domain-containing protein n=1 Tax=Streptomyces sp. NPDC006624 TaxID=3154892 RepID=UPI0033B09F76